MVQTDGGVGNRLYWVVWSLLAITLYLVPIPGLRSVRIDAIGLLVIFLTLYGNLRAPLLMSFGLGLIQDLVSLSPLGQHALGLVVVCFTIEMVQDRLRMLAPVAQLPAVLILLLLLKLIYSWVVALNVGRLPDVDAVFSVLLTAACWIPLSLLWRRSLVQRRRKPTYQ